MGAYEVNEHLPKLVRSGLGLAEYCRASGVSRRALALGIRTEAPERYAELVADGTISEQGDKPRAGAKLETSAKGMLERRGYVTFKSFASRSPVDLFAMRAGSPTLFVQAKKDGKLGSSEWNALFDMAEQAGAWPVLVSRPPGEAKGALWFRLARRREKRERQEGLLEPFDPREPAQATLLAPAAVA